MKKIIKDNFKPFCIILALVVLQSIAYLFVKLVQGEPHLLGNEIDKIFSFNMYFIIPYVFWYLLVFLIPLYFYKKNKKDFARYILAYLLMCFFADIFYVIYPTTVMRPDITGNSLIYFITKAVFMVDSPVLNCMPSLHAAASFLWVLFVFEKDKYNTSFKVFTFVSAVVIIFSTFYIKQHVVIDAVTGIALAIFVYFLAKKMDFHVNKIYKLLKM